MTAYFDAATREACVYASAFRDNEEAFLRAVGWLEAGIIRDVTRLTGDREFPDDLREQILGDIAVWRVDTGDLPETRGRQCARLSRRSELIERLHERFHELGRRRIATRFGLLTDDPLRCLVRRSEWEMERAIHLGQGETLCGRRVVDGIQTTEDVAMSTCWLCQLKTDTNRKRSGA
jgi:hypothetical protein